MISSFKYILFILFTILFVVKANSQITFNKTHSLDLVNSLAISVIETDSSYFISGVGVDMLDSFNVVASYLHEVDYRGETLNKSYFVDSTGSKKFEHFRPNLKRSLDGTFLLSGYQWESGELDPYIIKFDKDANIIFQTLQKSKFEKGNGFELDTDYLELPNGDIITVTRCQRDDQGNDAAAEICIYKLSAVGKLLWQKVIEDPSRRDFTGQLKLMPNGNIMIFGGKSKAHLEFHGPSWATLTEIDTSGNLVSTWISSQSEAFDYVRTGLVVDDGYILGSGILVEYDPDRVTIRDPMILKLNKNYEKEWKLIQYNRTDTLFSPALKYNKLIEVVKNQTFVACGSGHKGVPDSPVGDFSDKYGRLIKFDANGNLIWERNYQYFGDEVYIDDHFFEDVIHTTDGGFLACGEAFNANASSPINAQLSWLVKMDEHGCIVPGCHDLIDNTISVSNAVGLKLFPNPVSDVLNVSINHQGSYGEAQIIINNSMGQQLKTYPIKLPNLTMMIDVGRFMSGTYYLTYVVDGVVLRTKGFVKD